MGAHSGWVFKGIRLDNWKLNIPRLQTSEIRAEGGRLGVVVGDAFGILGTVQGDAFRVDEVVAEGGFAVVYRAYHQQFRANVALKCLKVPGSLSRDQREDFLERFRAEAELLFRLSTSLAAVVRPLHVGQLALADDRFAPFIALEWLEGHTLALDVEKRRRDSRPPLTVAQMVALLAPVARALERAHAFPGPDGPVAVLHRDLKPENIFVATVHGEQVLKILDFGLAKVKRAATQLVGHLSVEQSGVAAFTPAYAAPEQWLPKRFGQTGIWTDVWGLALTALETLCGHPPLDGDMTAIMGAAIDPQLRPTPRREGIEVGEQVEAVFLKALAVHPKDRYASVGEFWNDLEACVDVATHVKITRLAQNESLPPAAIEAAEREFVSSLPSLPSLISPRVPEPPSPAQMQGATGYGELDLEDADEIDIELHPNALDTVERTAPPTPWPNLQNRPMVERATLDDGTSTLRRESATRRSHHPVLSSNLTEQLAGTRAVEQGGLMPVVNMAASDYPLVRRAARPPSSRPSATSGLPTTQRVSGPLKLLALAVAIMAADWLYTINTGEIVSAGPLRPLWIAGPVGVIALGMIIYTVLTSD